MISETKNISLKENVCVLAVVLLLALPTIAAGQEKEKALAEDSDVTDLVTMPGMRSMVPSLVGLGWDNFFLNSRSGLSSDQIQKLLSIRDAFLAAKRLSEQRAMEAELLVYDELGRDQVSSRRVKERIAESFDLQGKVVALRFHYLLLGINVLNHEQHQKIVAFLKSGIGPISSRQSRGTIGWPPGPLPLSARRSSISGSSRMKNGGSGRSEGKRLMTKTYQNVESDPM